PGPIGREIALGALPCPFWDPGGFWPYPAGGHHPLFCSGTFLYQLGRRRLSFPGGEQDRFHSCPEGKNGTGQEPLAQWVDSAAILHRHHFDQWQPGAAWPNTI